MQGKIIGFNVSAKRGTVKHSVKEIEIDNLGIVGDAHRGEWHRQVTLISREAIDEFLKETGRRYRTGEFAVNIVLSGIDISTLRKGDRLKINDIILEITQIGKEPHEYDSPVYRETGKNVMFDQGLFTKVISGGKASLNNDITVIPQTVSEDGNEN